MDIAIDKVRTLILEARRIAVKEGNSDPDSGSNPTDDGNADVLTSSGQDGTGREFAGLVAGMNADERADLLALLYIGRGDFEAGDWTDAVKLARERDAESGHLARYLAGIPNLADLLEEGLATQGVDLVDDEAEALGAGEGDKANVVEIRHFRKGA